MRGQGHLSVDYIDDSYLQGQSKEDCVDNVKATKQLFTNAGFHLNSEKSVEQPTRTLDFLGSPCVL